MYRVIVNYKVYGFDSLALAKEFIKVNGGTLYEKVCSSKIIGYEN